MNCERLGTIGVVLLYAALTAAASVAEAVEFEKAAVAGKELTVCRVNLRTERLELFLKDEAGLPLRRLSRLAEWIEKRGQRLVFAMNAGMYHGDFSPVGLYVASGREAKPLNSDEGEGNFFMRPNGVFVVTDQGAKVVETTEYARLRLQEKVLLATQSGPMLVHGGKLHPKFNRESTSRLYRSGVAAPNPREAVFVISEAPVNFHEFASFFRDALGCKEALFLDGTICSLYAPELDRNDFRMDLGPMIGVTK